MRVVINQDENNNEVEIVINCKVIDDNIVKIIEKLRRKSLQDFFNKRCFAFID